MIEIGPNLRDLIQFVALAIVIGMVIYHTMRNR